jgi:uncharacterized C2H2 Zn-finger protein
VKTVLVVEPDGETTFRHCEDCDAVTRKIWGYISNDNGARAIYFTRWTDGHVERGAQIILSIGRWGEETTPSERRRVAVECRIGTDRPAFMVVDAGDFTWCQDDVLGETMTRAAVLADPIAQEAFSMLDALAECDERFRAFLLSEPANEDAAHCPDPSRE